MGGTYKAPLFLYIRKSPELNVPFSNPSSHFPGSSILVWDRSLEPSSPTGLRSGIALVSDTLMVQPTQRGFTYQWSVPNMVSSGPTPQKDPPDIIPP